MQQNPFTADVGNLCVEYAKYSGQNYKTNFFRSTVQEAQTQISNLTMVQLTATFRCV